MSQTLLVDVVAPPFAGHLFPLLDLCETLREESWLDLTILSTQDRASAIERCGLSATVLLPGREEEIHAIGDPGQRVGSNPFRLYRQFRSNMALMAELRDQLQARWTARRPDLVLADFTVPIAGLLAQSLGIAWWTATVSPCAIETRTATPSYLGGWHPRTDAIGRVRDAAGRTVIHGFKRTLAAVFAGDLRKLGVPGAYRPDDCEIVYSPERILGLGMREFEFERDWPPAFRFVGPLTGGPVFPHTAPEFEAGKRHVLVSLGTHLLWAKLAAFELLESVAGRMPECIFHFTHGVPNSTAHERRGNVRHYGYFPYDLHLPRYDAAIVHGGTGVLYSCVKAATPMLVWPQDFDHFDHAARVVVRGLGTRLVPRRDRIVADLRELLDDETRRDRLREFQSLCRHYDPKRTVRDEMRTLAESPRRSG